MYHFSRNTYSGRGQQQKRDYILEKIVAPACEICSETLIRKQYPCGKVESFGRFKIRKFCGWLCRIKAKKLTKKLPHCPQCDKQLTHYPKIKGEISRCRNCYNLFRIQTKR